MNWVIIQYDDLHNDELGIRDHLNDLTELARWGEHTLDFIYTQNITECLSTIDTEKYQWAVVMAIGNFISDQRVFKDIVDYAQSQDTPLCGHILDRGGYFHLHPQFFAVDLRIYQKLGSPKLEQSWNVPIVIETVVTERSKENVHDDYTPLWIKPVSLEKTTYHSDHEYFGIHFIAALISNGYEIKNIPNAMRDKKIFCYPDYNQTKIKSLLQDPDFFIDQQEDRDLYRLQQKVCPPMTEVKKIFYSTNSERLAPPVNGTKFDFYAGVCGGVKTIFNLSRNDFVDGSKVILFDISDMAIEYQKYLRANWDGNVDSMPSLINEFKSLHPIAVEHGFSNSPRHNIQWMLDGTGINDEQIRESWEFYKTLDVEIVELDLLGDSAADILKSKFPQTTLSKYIWISNSFSMYRNVFLYTGKGCRSKKSKFIDSLLGDYPLVIEDSGYHEIFRNRNKVK